MPNVNVVYGALGTRSMFAGMDLTCEMGVAHALGETAPIHKTVTHEKESTKCVTSCSMRSTSSTI